MLPRLLVLFGIISLVICSPIILEHHYYSGGKEVRRLNYSTPVTFNGVSIGTTELNSTAANGTIHALSDGHHFTHRGWALTTEANRPVWQYLPNLPKSANPKSIAKRQDETDDIWMEFLYNNVELIDSMVIAQFNDFEDLYDLTNGAVSTAEGVSWDATSPFSSLEFFWDGDYVTSTTELVGELVDIIFDAIYLFL